MKLALLVLVAAVIASCDLGLEPRCLNDRIPYSAVKDTITLVHCSTVDSLVLHHDSTKAKP